MNRRGFFSLSVAAAALAAIARVKPAAAAPSAIEYDFGGPHEFGYSIACNSFGVPLDPSNACHTHSISFVQDATHRHTMNLPTNWKFASIEHGPVLR